MEEEVAKSERNHKAYKTLNRRKTEDVVVRRMKVSTRSAPVIEEYRKMYNLLYQKLWRKVLEDWQDRCMDSSVLQRLKNNKDAGVSDEYKSMLMFTSDYIRYGELAAGYGMTLNKFFPRMVDDWCDRCCGKLDDFCEL